MAKDTRAGSKVRGDKLPAILMASHLLEGDTVFLIKGGWTRDPRDARIAHDQARRQRPPISSSTPIWCRSA